MVCPFHKRTYAAKCHQKPNTSDPVWICAAVKSMFIEDSEHWQRGIGS